MQVSPALQLSLTATSWRLSLSLSLPINNDDLCGMTGAISNLDGGLMM